MGEGDEGGNGENDGHFFPLFFCIAHAVKGGK